MKPSFFDLNYDDLKAILVEKGFSPFGATQMFDWVYRKWIHDPNEWSNVSKGAKAFFSENYDFSLFIKLFFLNNVILEDFFQIFVL